eukprot:TRINITY_DN13948_c0_g1_i1.p1 TRINITY_DN13948_c0_g1~~TRINITY_DN13948_c0_g1_i1.p1  ORF type:complete len:159 (-),score=38.63 TRINITY_DN13948_c0_g1_i1:46-522(-)
MGGSHSSADKNHIYEEINEKQFEEMNGMFDRKESTATLDIRVEDLGEHRRRLFDQAEVEWGNEDDRGHVEGGDNWIQDIGWGHDDARKMRTRKRGDISNVTFYENIESNIYDNESIAEANNDSFELEKTPEIRNVKYERCKSIDIKVLDIKDGESIEF